MAIIAIYGACVIPLISTSPISLSDSGQDRGFSFIGSLRLRTAIHSGVDDRSNICRDLQLSFRDRSGSVGNKKSAVESTA
ncbi:MAG: hypothetical protein ACI9UN_004713 [Granulosicoccus sp.]|jgi:hypothetical protein